MKILITLPKGEIRNAFFHAETAARVHAMGEVVWNDTEEQFTPEQLTHLLKGCQVCITGWSCPRLTAEVLAQAENLQILAHTGGTVAPYISDALYEKGVHVLSANDVYAESVAEGTIAYMLCALRELPYYNDLVHNGGWRGSIITNEGLLDKTVGLVGYGAITKHLLRMLQPFHCRIKLFSNHLSKEACAALGAEKASLPEIFSTCQIISLHNALTPQTYHSINRELLEQIPNNSILVNTARGAVIDEAALVQALSAKRFRAVLDVFEEEPLASDHPLRRMDNVLLIPHMAGPTGDRFKISTEVLLDDISAFYAGKPMHHEITRSGAERMTR